MDCWKYVGIRGHIFTYDLSTGYISCSCGRLGTRVSKEQAVPTSERHVRHRARAMGSLVLEDLTVV